jgi:hypothetical protein
MSDLNRRRLSPAASIVRKFTNQDDAGVKVLAEICGVDQSRVYRWMYGSEFGGTDGMIPPRHHKPILTAARDRGIALSADELIGYECAAA